MLSLVRSFLVSAVIFGLLNLGPLTLPAAGAEQPVGVVVLSQSGYLDKERAVNGVDVYPGDALNTDAGGSLRVKVGTSQIYLFSASAGSLARGQGKIQARLSGGSMGFSSTPADQVAVETNIAEIRAANGGRAYGQVTVTGPTTLTVAAYRGSLTLSGMGAAAGEEHTIKEGETYNVSFIPDAAEAPAAPSQNGSSVPQVPYKSGHLLLISVVAGIAAMGVVAGVLYHHYETESSSAPSTP